MAKARCPKYRHYVLCGECLVDLDQVHVLDSQVGASQGHLEGGDGAEAAGARIGEQGEHYAPHILCKSEAGVPHDRRLDASAAATQTRTPPPCVSRMLTPTTSAVHRRHVHAPRYHASQRRQAVGGDRLLAGHNHSSSAVGDARRGAGRHSAVLLEHRGQPAKRLGGGAGAWSLVRVEHVHALATLDLHAQHRNTNQHVSRPPTTGAQAGSSRTSIGSISDLNLPAALASAQACWLRAPYASVSARVRLYSSARFSAVMPMGVLHRLSVSPAQSVSTSCQRDRQAQIV